MACMVFIESTRVLRDLRARGLRPWRATVADGHLGIWAALGEIFPEGEEQRCWNHRLMNVVDQLPKRVWPEAKALLRKIPYAESLRECEQLRDQFGARYGRLYPKAVQTLGRDWERMVTFYRFPKEHWRHLRTSNVVESPFAAVRLRTDAAKRYKKVANAEALIWKILRIAEKRFRRLNAPELLEEVYQGKKFVDGVPVTKVNRRLAA
ncbi:MAG: transposase [Deltaproteobacteria bacterium]|nr:transposase [Deltaproteobacteria bacterium]